FGGGGKTAVCAHRRSLLCCRVFIHHSAVAHRGIVARRGSLVHCGVLRHRRILVRRERSVHDGSFARGLSLYRQHRIRSGRGVLEGGAHSRRLVRGRRHRDRGRIAHRRHWLTDGCRLALHGSRSRITHGGRVTGGRTAAVRRRGGRSYVVIAHSLVLLFNSL